MNDNSITHRYRGRLFINSDDYLTTKKKLESGFISNDNYLSFLSTTKYDSNFIDNLLVISASAIMADGAHEEIETKILMELCDEFRIDRKDFSRRLEKELSEITNIDYNFILNYLKSRLKINDNENNSLLFESALHIILADGIMTMNECKLLADIGELLNIPTALMIARLGLFLRKEQEILVDVEEVISWQSLASFGE